VVPLEAAILRLSAELALRSEVAAPTESEAFPAGLEAAELVWGPGVVLPRLAAPALREEESVPASVALQARLA
jgi:hypothetical protein